MLTLRSPCVPGAVLALAGAAAAQTEFAMSYPISGRQEFSSFGTAVAIVGDIDGDGVDDLLIGAPGEHSNLSVPDGAGVARLYSGATGDVFRSVAGTSFNHNLGAAVAGLGDVNDDSVSEYIIAIPGLNAVRVYSGASGDTLYTVFGSDNTLFGHDISAAGDVNNDGRTDFIISAPNEFDGNGFRTGAAWVHSGVDGAVLYTRHGQSAMDLFGLSVAGAGDVNNDGFDDFVVGAPGENSNGADSGTARVYSGATGAVLRTFIGLHAGDEMGRSVCGAGDVNNDGFDDIIVGAMREDANAVDGGSVRVFSGASGAALHTWHGTQVFEFVGWSVGAAGDVNGDGFDDLITGTPWADGDIDDVGRVQVLSGADGAVLDTRFGTAPLAFFGSVLGSGGDLNADGVNDVLLGLPSDNAYGPSTGSVRILLSQVAPATCTGDTNNDTVVDFNDIVSVLGNWLSVCP